MKDAKVLFYGAGSSAVGVANMIATLIEKEGGLSEKEAKAVSITNRFQTLCRLLFKKCIAMLQSLALTTVRKACQICTQDQLCPQRLCVVLFTE